MSIIAPTHSLKGSLQQVQVLTATQGTYQEFCYVCTLILSAQILILNVAHSWSSIAATSCVHSSVISHSELVWYIAGRADLTTVFYDDDESWQTVSPEETSSLGDAVSEKFVILGPL